MKMKIALAALCLSLSLTACTDRHQPIESMRGFKAEREARLATEATEAIAAGKTLEALDKYERLYGDKPKSPEIALNYAQLLRKAGKTERAVDILQPFVGGKDGKNFDKKANGLLLNEYAAAQIELGNLEIAQNALNHVLLNETMQDYHADAYNLMGITMDAQGLHQQAEEMFNKALTGWKGDPTSVMNNLALCLASLGKFDEGLTMLRQALIIQPSKKELARNIEYIESLRASVVPSAPLAVRPAAVEKPVPVKKAVPKPAPVKPITENEMK
jgi:Flp pilus assembly protein TadD